MERYPLVRHGDRSVTERDRAVSHAPRPASLLAGLAASAAIGLAAYRGGALSKGGVAGAMLTGTAIFAGGGLAPSALLLTFFTSSAVLSRWRAERKRTATGEMAKGERRDLAQTLANGGVAAALVVVGRVWPRTPWLPALVGALATVNADTWATEIGLLSRRPPRLLLSDRVVEPGLSGGVTPLGLGAACCGAALIGAVAAAGTSPRGWHWVGLATGAGLAGCLADSLLGATVQARYRCPVCGVNTERRQHRCGAPTELTGGWHWVENDAVNFASSLVGAAFGWGLARWRGESPVVGSGINE
jgi:uncharacterized protein (TIGR00297 family)